MTATDAPARAALLRRLPADGFVPAEDATPWSTAARCAAFAADVEAFAAAFWSLTPADRRVRFNTLWNARYGLAATRLGEIEHGLDYPRTTARGGSPSTIQELVRELAAIRARGLPEFLEDVHTGAFTTPIPAGTTGVLAPITFLSDALPTAPDRFSGMSHGADRHSRLSDLWHANPRLLIGLVAVVAVVLMVLIDSHYPNWLPAVHDPRTVFTYSEVSDFLSYRDGLRQGKSYRPAPPRYADWLVAGMPAGRSP